MRYREPQPGVITLPLLNTNEAGEILGDLKANTDWNPAKISTRKRISKESKAVRSAMAAALPSSSPHAELIDARIRSIVRPIIYQRWNHDILRHTSVQLVRYTAGDFFAVHRDNGSSFNERYYTVVCYLNDDFDGGGTYFPDSDYTVQPEAGKAVIFPSDYLHRANEILKGVKYIAVIWMLDTPPVDWI
ncbi:MAG: prolyl hydroxylase family protein [Rhodothermales bacterium]